MNLKVYTHAHQVMPCEPTSGSVTGLAVRRSESGPERLISAEPDQHPIHQQMQLEPKTNELYHPVTDALVEDTLADLRNNHPLVSKLALQRFAAQLRRLRSTELEALKEGLLTHRGRQGLSDQEQDALSRMFTLVETASENRRLRIPRMTAPLTEHYPVIGRGIGEAVSE
ncbi:hypothetical protein COW36_02000 [bacterium (Candidatus Blackallbacteria) CG17_big_fil_post_rev_8_21_14_2_50_48_46]|uniref:Uncharacterized protein n=1 Tax=bacterium (Candidatus Blackallbacteria) CG17_big_fil_post_rev_8_21_14_2_50_48_46 TaxID=2014261 RepID=A0A2M7GAN3_9BACT|nr:MAG: hypothetical protein COW64_26390 [bacterium (Candidatus Blackallbacteria) CG18_big_fil_WC_8_21_14_2_50_49_26]PIW19207.1 MAG: hypothetical protein COW36_02000 [bacterium (Candidatus Blackallbacteria) CG17_big_fil_post_rev_8_21_14_2_50_48_46]PIW45443.1 MAG: hypothetical protein COW20_20140 [bacterium (Candidatus Blackallbacteria) CG13_big_fil_rev_8_21_14_2_50_49_14]